MGQSQSNPLASNYPSIMEETGKLPNRDLQGEESVIRAESPKTQPKEIALHFVSMNNDELSKSVGKPEITVEIQTPPVQIDLDVEPDILEQIRSDLG